MAVAIPIIVVIFIILCNLLIYLGNENSILRNFWKGRRRLLAITNRLPSNERPSLYWAWDVLDPNHMITGVVPQWMLLAYRCGMLCMFVFTIVYQALVSGFSDPTFAWLTFYTNWTFVGFGLTSVLGIAVLLEDMIHPRPSEKQEWIFLRKICLLTYITVSSSSFFLTIFYWAVDYNGGHVSLDNVLRHGVNVIVLMGDMLMNRLPVVTYHFQGNLFYGTAYLAFMWPYYGISGDWVYSSLNWNRTSSLIYYGVIPLLMILGFGSIYGLVTFRERVILKRISEAYSPMEPGEIQLGQVTVVNTGENVQSL